MVYNSAQLHSHEILQCCVITAHYMLFRTVYFPFELLTLNDSQIVHCSGTQGLENKCMEFKNVLVSH